ncbi:phospholipase C [Silvibacterium dinghuense]|uniref:Phospholipase n=1 Tax=Silvibacterium dinghuense TaxID=1560006 RepID=A0A4Q1SKF1_9BACT|nr:alkaline phosphatase family protein [Silvibacterium dinghuense]RXS97770.1 phospholipase [Silvibacterium dinghuense]GGH01884.1 phospholipase C [Silvibacterium dinghuense]
MHKHVATSLAALLVAGQLASPNVSRAQDDAQTTTPIKHVVVIFGENISFDHYFGTYPYATNPKGEPAFYPAAGTPTVNGLTGGLLTSNPNSLNTANGSAASNPFRLDRTQAATADQDHGYTPEQEAFHKGLMDSFPEYTGTAGPPPTGVSTKGLVMGYFDGNTVTALWNYAQNFALSDNAYDTNFGPSTPGAINLVSGQTNGVIDQSNASGDIVADGNGGYTLMSDADPIGDICSTTTGALVQLGGQNIGDLLNAKGISWGWFEGGFNTSLTNSNKTTGCSRSTTSSVTGVTETDYIPHHEPFQYYTSTANPKHLRPSSTGMIGKQGDQANHQYDINDFYTALNAGNLPAVSFLKAPGYEDAHAGYSDPLDEQTFVVTVINALMRSSEWSSTAVIINYDDSDGWYDHQMSPIVNQSATAADMLTGTGTCGSDTATTLPGISGTAHAQGRCGYGPRLPLLVISPYAKRNFVDHGTLDQSSIIHFIEDNWLGGERIGGGSFDAISGSIDSMFDFHHRRGDATLILNPSTGQVTAGGAWGGNGGWGDGDGGNGGRW